MAKRTIEISTEYLGKDIDNLKNTLTSLKQDKYKMTGEIEELNTMWKGPANEVFVKQFHLDCVSFDNLIETIDKMIGEMEHAKAEYEKCDNKVSDIVRALRI